MWTRRTVIESASVASVLAGCLGGDAEDDGNEENESSPGYETHLDEIDDYDPVDRTGRTEVEITVAPDGENRFEPDPVMVEEMTTVTWTWGERGYEVYPVDIPDPCQWSGSDGGRSHSWQFPFVGKYEVGCTTPDDGEFTGVMFVVEPDE